MRCDSRIREAFRVGREADDWTGIIKDTLKPSDPYFFYDAKEISALLQATLKINKDPTITRSQYIGLVANKNRGFIIFRTPRYNGMKWSEKEEYKVVAKASNFCGKCIPNSSIDIIAPVCDAIIFYQTKRELLNVLTKSTVVARDGLRDFGKPYKHIYAIPFTYEGLKIFQNILLSPAYEKDCIQRICEADPGFEQNGEAQVFQLMYLGEISCLLSYPMELRRVFRFLSSPHENGCGIVGCKWQQEVFSELVPNIPYLDMDI